MVVQLKACCCCCCCCLLQTLPQRSIAVFVSPLHSFCRDAAPRGVLGLMFAGYVPLASQSPYSIIVYFLANYRPHLSHFLENIIFAIPT